MRPVCFLTHTGNPGSVRRYLNTSAELIARGIPIGFIDVDGGGTAVLNQEVARAAVERCWLEEAFVSAGTPSGASRPIVPELPGSDRPLFRPAVGSLNFDSTFGFSDTLAGLGFDGSPLFARLLAGHAETFLEYLSVAREVLGRVRPGCIVFDLCYTYGVAALIEAAREAGIPTVLMQHAAGVNAFYSCLPDMADRYVAYNRYNIECLARMGVPPERIWLTGAPEGAPTARGTAERAEVLRQLGLPERRKIVLVALKPAREDFSGALRQWNSALLDAVEEVLLQDGRFFVVVRRHPSDAHHPSGAALPMSAETIARFSENLRITDAEDPLEPWLHAADAVITLRSNTLVEAVESGVQVFLVDHRDTDGWPDWERIPAFISVPPAQTREYLRLLCQDPPAEPRISPDLRRRFIEQFGLNRRSDSAARLAAEIAHVIAVGL